MPQFCSSWRLLLTLERAIARVVAISSAGNGRGERKRRAWIWATVRLIPQRVPISPQWRMNFWATGESVFIYSVISVCTEIRELYLKRQANSTAGGRFEAPPDRVMAIRPE